MIFGLEPTQILGLVLGCGLAGVLLIGWALVTS